MGPQDPESSYHPKKLLIIEDDFYVRDIYKIEAKSHGYEVYEAVDGAEGMQQTKLIHPDIILLDIMLPKVNGIDVLKTIKSWDGFKDIPIVIISNISESEVYQQALQAGAAEYIIKFESTPQKIIESLSKHLHAVTQQENKSIQT